MTWIIYYDFSTAISFVYPRLCLEGFLFGLYAGIFAIYLQYTSQKETDNTQQDIIFYALCILFVLSGTVVLLDIATFVTGGFTQYDISNMAYHLGLAQILVFGCCDFIAQFVLIYRCWIVWGRNIRVVIIPLILAFAFIVMWITASPNGMVISQGLNSQSMAWGHTLVLIGLAVSMTVNALVTGLIVFKIFKVSYAVKGITTSKSMSVTGGRKIRSIMFIIIESGMALFAIQLVRLVISATPNTLIEYDVMTLIIGIHEMLNGITPTIILVRVSMGFSFHDEPSLVEAVSSLRFAADDSNPISGTGIISQDGNLCVGTDYLDSNPEMINISQERRDEYTGQFGRGNDIHGR